MAKNGGYKIIDFNGSHITFSGVTIPGIFDAIESTNKATLLSGVVLDSGESVIEMDDFYGTFIYSEGVYTIDIPGAITLTITDEDLVTVS